MNERYCANCRFAESRGESESLWRTCLWGAKIGDKSELPFWVGFAGSRPSRRVHANWGKGCLAWKRKEAAK